MVFGSPIRESLLTVDAVRAGPTGTWPMQSFQAY